MKAKRYISITSMIIIIVFALALVNLTTLYYISSYQKLTLEYTAQYIPTQDTLPYEILNLNEQINVNRTGACFFRISMTVNYTDTTSILQFPVDFKNIFALETYLGEGKTNNTIDTLHKSSNIKVYLPSERSQGSQDNLTILFFTTDLVYELTEYFEFEYFVTFPTETYLFTLTVRLPEGGKLIDPVRGPSIFPYPTANWTDGTYFYFQWEVLEIKPSTQMSFVIKYFLEPLENLDGGEQEHPVIGVAQLTGLLLGIGVSVLIVYTSFMVFSKRRGGGIELLLSENERKVVRALLKRGGKCKQFEIVLDTKLSKAAVSIALSSLEKKRLIRRERYGKLNIIHATDKLKDFISPEFETEKKEDEK